MDVGNNNERTVIIHLYDTTEKQIYILCKKT